MISLTVGDGASYKLAKYTDTNMSSAISTTTTAKIGLLRLGELMSGQFDRYLVKGVNSSTGLTTGYWTLTPYSSSKVRYVDGGSSANSLQLSSFSSGARPTMNLKSNVIITGGTGLKNDPFTLELAN